MHAKHADDQKLNDLPRLPNFRKPLNRTGIICVVCVHLPSFALNSSFRANKTPA
jgi:hypothetical protein